MHVMLSIFATVAITGRSCANQQLTFRALTQKSVLVLFTHPDANERRLLVRREAVVSDAVVAHHELVLERARALSTFLSAIDGDLTPVAAERRAVAVHRRVLT